MSDEPERTIIQTGATPAADPAAPAERTIIMPAASPASSAAGDPPSVGGPKLQPAESTIIAPAATAAPPPVQASTPRKGGIQVGDVLNHIFEVKRFLARGGMGEVFEGVNVNSDERVAIKVILPSLAADPNVLAMFRKEAQTLTRLSHPALVQYRVLAQEPALGVFYIVTEFIDGANLSDLLGKMQPGPADLVALLKRLAAGLGAAHALGAIHRDISPDNVMLEGGRLEAARIIDFGIAKDLDPGSKTIIGDGFAGKLGYVAPEQLGDFGRQVGPWTDVYSLALVILALAGGRNLDMGGSYAEAIDRRRAGPDLSAAPAILQPVLKAMLAPDPAQRLRSMDAVLDMLAAPPAPSAAPRTAEPAAGSGKRKLILGGAAGLAVLLGGGAWLAFGGTSDAPPATPNPAAAAGAATRNPSAVAETALATSLPTVPCAWLDVASAWPAGSGVSLAFSGVAGQPAQAEATVSRAVAAAGATVSATDFSDVAPISGTECTSIDAFRQIRAAPGADHLQRAQKSFEMSRMADGQYAGKLAARTVITLNLAGVTDFALYGLEPSGQISAIVPNRAAFERIKSEGIIPLGNERYRLEIDIDHQGWSGYLLLTGKGGFATDVVTAGPGVRTENWRQRFETAAAGNGWRAEMVWLKTIDAQPD